MQDVLTVFFWNSFFQLDLVFIQTLYGIRDVHKSGITEEDFSEVCRVYATRTHTSMHMHTRMHAYGHARTHARTHTQLIKHQLLTHIPPLSPFSSTSLIFFR